jgi:hypothetical protein
MLHNETVINIKISIIIKKITSIGNVVVIKLINFSDLRIAHAKSKNLTDFIKR